MNINRCFYNFTKICRGLKWQLFSGTNLNNGLNQLQYNCYSTKIVYESSNRKSKGEYFKSLISKIPFLDIKKYRLKASGFVLYESIDKLSYVDFFKQYSLPDTFNSWFLVTELHVWMLSVRVMAETEYGRTVRNSIVEALWSDVNTRSKELGASSPSRVRSQVDELSQQFNASLFLYDEALQSNDQVLANALWRRFFNHKCENLEYLESLVGYVRKQIRMLDGLTSDEIFEKRHVPWIPLKQTG